MRIPSTMALLLLALLLPSFPAVASKPAVRELNGRVFGGYLYERTQNGSQQAGGSSVLLPTTTGRQWDVGGVLTSPLYRWLGGRLRVAGGGTRTDRLAGPGFSGSSSDTSRIDAGVTVFLRDPEIGHFDVGYGFRWEDPSDPTVDRITRNAVTCDVGFYIPDQGIGPLDWDFFFSYDRASLRSPSFSEGIDDYRAGAVLGWYLGDSWRLSGGLRWSMTDPAVSLSGRELRGTADLAWLLPLGSRRMVAANVYGNGGTVHVDLAPPFTSADRVVFSVGAGLTFSYPGASSLIELTRELH